MSLRKSNNCLTLTISTICILLLTLALAIFWFAHYYYFGPDAHLEACHYKCTERPFQSELGEACSPSVKGNFTTFAVSTDSNVCAPTGKKILQLGGNAVDAAIATLLCMGVTIPDSMGLGGGFMAVVYNASTWTSTTINAREVAPLAASRDMFNRTSVFGNGIFGHGNSNWNHTSGFPKNIYTLNNNNNRSYYGLESIAVPGELAGYWRLYNRFGSGRVPWKALFTDAVQYARYGFPVGQHFSDALEALKETILKLPTLREAYLNPETEQLYGVGQIFRQRRLANTLDMLANSYNPLELFYGQMSKQILNDLFKQQYQFPGQEVLISQADFQAYEVIEKRSFTTDFGTGQLKLHTAPLPTGGVLLSFLLRVMDRFVDLVPAAKFDHRKAVTFYHRFLEAMKFTFASRTYLGDDRFDDVDEVLKNLTSERYIVEIANRIQADDERTFSSYSSHYDLKKQYNEVDIGTAHVSVIDGEGNAVSVTSTINHYFGSKVFSPSTGILLNNEMDDFNSGRANRFNLANSGTNFIYPGKRPLSSASPAIFTDPSGVRLVLGASGGPRIITAVAAVALRHLWFGEEIKRAVDSSRLHHQLFPEVATFDQCFPPEVAFALRRRGHNMTQLARDWPSSVVMAISRARNGRLEANSDYRKGGTVDGV